MLQRQALEDRLEAARLLAVLRDAGGSTAEQLLSLQGPGRGLQGRVLPPARQAWALGTALG